MPGNTPKEDLTRAKVEFHSNSSCENVGHIFQRSGVIQSFSLYLLKSFFFCVLYLLSLKAESSPVTSHNPSLSSTPQNTSFLTEENMKKISLPKKIEF
jgi:hypothetical protein